MTLEISLSVHGGKLELGRIRIENTAVHPDGTTDYSVQFAVDRVGAVGLHQRSIRNFPREKINALGLLLAALQTLDEKELRLEDDISASDMERKIRGTLPPFST